MKTNTETKFKQTEMKTVDLNNEILFEFKNGLWESKNDRDSVNAIVIRGTNFSEMGDIKGQLLNIKVENKELENKRLTFGDILIERSGGGPKQPVGRVLFFDINDDKNIYSFSNFVTRLRILQKDILMPRYVFYNLLHFYKFSIGSNFQHGSTGIRNLDFKKYKSDVRIKIIDISEQKKIAGVLSKIQEAVENQRKIIEKLEELKKSTMDKLFKNGLYGKETKQTEIGKIPYDWEVVKVCDVLIKIEENKNSELQSCYKDKGKYPIIDQGKNFISGYSDDEKKVYKNNIPLIVFGDHTRVLKYVNFPFVAGADGTKLLKANEKMFEQKFFYYSLLNIKIPNRGYNRHFKLLKEQKIPLPPLSEQKKIAEILSKIDNMKEEAEKKLDYLNEFFNSALDLLITGKVRLN